MSKTSVVSHRRKRDTLKPKEIFTDLAVNRKVSTSNLLVGIRNVDGSRRGKRTHIERYNASSTGYHADANDRAFDIKAASAFIHLPRPLASKTHSYDEASEVTVDHSKTQLTARSAHHAVQENVVSLNREFSSHFPYIEENILRIVNYIYYERKYHQICLNEKHGYDRRGDAPLLEEKEIEMQNILLYNYEEPKIIEDDVSMEIFLVEKFNYWKHFLRNPNCFR